MTIPIKNPNISTNRYKQLLRIEKYYKKYQDKYYKEFKENQQLKERINKAIEYINKKATKREIQETRNIVNILYSLELNNHEFIELEDILKGEL